MKKPKIRPISATCYAREIALLTKLNADGDLSNAAYVRKWKALKKRLEA